METQTKQQETESQEISEISWTKSPVNYKAFDSYELDWHKACQEARDKVYSWMDIAREGKVAGLVLWSDNYGCGKTHLAKAACAALGAVPTPPWGFRKHGLFLTSEQFYQSIRDAYSDNGSPSPLFTEWTESPYVVMDDVGKEYIANKDWGQEQFFKFINRVHETRALLMTSNLSPAELQERIGGASMSRLIGMCGRDGFVNMSGIPDYRITKNASQRAR